jgi:cell division septal protein FtsQ
MEVVRQPVFWVMYLMFVLVGAGGLMAVAQLAPIAKDFKIADVPVSLITGTEIGQRGASAKSGDTRPG